MINGIEIRNYKCFQLLKIPNCRRVNIVVGDNGAGKTALLEAIFLTLGGNAQVAVRNRQARGFDGVFSGTSRAIEDALWSDLFYNFDTGNPISVVLSGRGPAARSVFISKGRGSTLIPLGDVTSNGSTGNFQFIWKDHLGNEHDGSPSFQGSALSFPAEREHLPDFFFFSSAQIGTASENAARFSELSKARRQRQFVELFVKEYPWIEDLSIEVVAGQPVIHATLREMQEKLPLNSISSGINRILSVLLVMASHPECVVIVDEIENGLYYKHQRSFWRWLMSFANNTKSQLFLSTHSDEWLRALVDISTVDMLRNIAFWRVERGDHGMPELFEFSGEDLRAGIEYGTELRGGSE